MHAISASDARQVHFGIDANAMLEIVQIELGGWGCPDLGQRVLVGDTISWSLMRVGQRAVGGGGVTIAEDAADVARYVSGYALLQRTWGAARGEGAGQ